MAGFQKATKLQAKARIAIDGPSGAGKTWTGLVTATVLAGGGKIAVIDSERGSASKYADRFEFDVLELDGSFHPERYIEGIREAAKAGYAVVLIDSLTHAWAGAGGVLEVVDASKSKFGVNSYMAWSVGTPLWQSLIDAMLGAPMHVIATMRSKSKFVEGEKAGGGKTYTRTGTEPVARNGVEYEFDVVGDLDLEHTMVVSKSRAGDRLQDIYRRPGPDFGEAVLEWLTDGAVDTKALARELSAAAGDTDALRDALAKAKIGMDDLADEKKLAKARGIAKKIADDREQAGKDPATRAADAGNGAGTAGPALPSPHREA
ncbi:MAG: AAA family ATPase, partial [Chloroflexi bacterium]|nr:AAA family ATPase [Chloroflexota bacterium]